MTTSITTTAPPARPRALLVAGDILLREALERLLGTPDDELFEVLRQVLADKGYDVVVTPCPDEARRLVQEQTFDRIYSGGAVLMSQEPARAQDLSGPRVEDLGNGTARVQIDQVLPWSKAVELLDVLADTPPQEPRRLS